MIYCQIFYYSSLYFVLVLHVIFPFEEVHDIQSNNVDGGYADVKYMPNQKGLEGKKIYLDFCEKQKTKGRVLWCCSGDCFSDIKDCLKNCPALGIPPAKYV